MQNQNLRPLTLKEKTVLEFIEGYFIEKEIAPSFMEIKDHFGFASNNSVQRYLKQLTSKGYIFIPSGNQKRAITLLHPSNTLHKNFTTPYNNLQSARSVTPPPVTGQYSLPLLGKIAAGLPIEALEHNETIDVPFNFVQHPDKSYVLQVQGESMIESGIHNGDMIVVEDTNSANNGDIIVAVIDNEATLKKYYFHKDKNLIELRPSNSSMESMWHHPKLVNIKGILKNLLRKY